MHTLALIDHLQNDLFARGGGGGSGGGGGGGGSGGGGGDGGGVFVLLGYLPTHFIGSRLRRKLYNPLGFALMVIATIAYSGLWLFAGWFGAFVAIAALFGGPAGFFGFFGKISARVRKRARQKIVQAQATDPAWDVDVLDQRVRAVFLAFQKDWSDFNLQNIKKYLTPKYASHIELMLAAIKLRGRRNIVENPQLVETFPVEVNDLLDNTKDKVTYYIHAKADDKLIENIEGNTQQLFEDNNEFYEYWSFARVGHTWLLDGISQLTANKLSIKPNILQFATENGMHYSPDWGWLLLPRRGQLFKDGKFGRSDVNNHVIGVYHNLLVELYTYLPSLSQSSRATPTYTIAQTALPKRYDSFIVKARSAGFGAIFERTPKGYNKLSLEWPDFNKRYTVYATNVEQVTAFELLHPVYMEKLFALPFKVSIEVVDNVVYLYSTDTKADYATMYSLLQDAFAEMKL